MIGIRTSNATWIASTVARQRHHRQDDANNDNKLLHFVNIFDSKNNNVAIVCTGIQGDAVWLLEQIQSHASSTWERYGSSLSAASVASAIQRLVRIFWDYDMENTLQRIDLKDNWARPLGVRTFVVSSSALYVVEPSGNIVQGDVLCMGKHSKELQVLLEEKIKKRGDENVQDIIVELVSSRVVEGSGVDHLLIEILSSDGQLERRRVKLK